MPKLLPIKNEVLETSAENGIKFKGVKIIKRYDLIKEMEQVDDLPNSNNMIIPKAGTGNIVLNG